jgi:hypothetical protein
MEMSVGNVLSGPSKWPRGLRRSSAAAVLLGLQVRIPPGHGYLSLVCALVLRSRCLCIGPITRLE